MQPALRQAFARNLIRRTLSRSSAIRAIIGKGEMGAKTLAALKENDAVYMHAIGGAAQVYSQAIEEVKGVDFPEFGVPEAMWHVRAKEFPTIVTMDAHGNRLHADVEKASAAELAKFKEAVIACKKLGSNQRLGDALRVFFAGFDEVL